MEISTGQYAGDKIAKGVRLIFGEDGPDALGAVWAHGSRVGESGYYRCAEEISNLRTRDMELNVENPGGKVGV